MASDPDAAVLRAMLGREYDADDPCGSLPGATPSGALMRLRKGSVLLRKGQTLDHLYVLLDGRLSVWNLLPEGRDELTDYLWPLDVAGLVEVLNDEPAISAWVMADTDCVVYRFEVGRFCQLLRADGELCFLALRMLGKVTAYNMLNSAEKSTLSNRDIIGRFLWVEATCRGDGSGVWTCPLTRAELAERLHLNLRTLYRHIAILAQEGFVRLDAGKITVGESELARLNERYERMAL